MLIALFWSGLGMRLWIQALCQHTLAVSGFVRAICSCPNLVLLEKDVAAQAVASALNRQGSLQNTIFTTSNYFSQPLWSWAMPERDHMSHIVWYSQNLYPISYSDETEAVSIPNLGFIRADIQWVWSEGFRSFLESICPPCVYKVVPPVVWHLPSKRVPKGAAVRRIALFDVTPISTALEVKFGLIRNFYSDQNISWFIRDVIAAAQEVSQQRGIKIEVVLKHKRNHRSNFHSSEYISTISKLVDDGAITLVDPVTNLHDLIANSDVIVAAPYSSPVYLGLQAGKVAFWYDPTETIDWKLESPEIELVSGKQRLSSELLQIFL
jgi:polysaccharide biosynthesis PFTS motif protein